MAEKNFIASFHGMSSSNFKSVLSQIQGGEPQSLCIVKNLQARWEESKDISQNRKCGNKARHRSYRSTVQLVSLSMVTGAYEKPRVEHFCHSKNISQISSQ